jgi:RecA/RadA recombinase
MSTLIEKILKTSPTKNASILSSSVFFHEKDVIPTDLPILNIAFSGSLDGGVSSGLTVFAGQSKSFKTLLGLFCVKAYLDKYKDGVCVFYDSEGGVTPEYLISNGINPDRVVHVPIEHIEMLKFDMVKTLKEIDRKDKVIMMIDSIGNTASLKELEDAENEKSVAEMQRAKSLKALFRMVTPSLISKDVPCIAIAHTYQEMGLYPKAIISGGTGLLYSSNQAFIITKSQEKDGTDLAGFKFTINVEKSRFVREKSKLPFTVLYETGIQKWSSLFDLAIESGHIQKANQGWYNLVDMETGEIIEPKRRSKDIENDDEFFKKLIENQEFKVYIEHRYKLNGMNLKVDTEE